MSAKSFRLVAAIYIVCSALSSPAPSRAAGTRKEVSADGAKHADRANVEKKYLPYLIALLNRNVGVLKKYSEEEQEAIQYWKWLGPRMNHIVSGLAENFLPDHQSPQRARRSLEKPISDDLLDWFVGGFGEESKFGDKFRQLKSSTSAIVKQRVSRDSEKRDVIGATSTPVQLSGVTIKVMGIEDAGPKVGEVLKMEVQNPRPRRSAAERAHLARAYAENLKAVKSKQQAQDAPVGVSNANSLIDADPFFAPRVLKPTTDSMDAMKAELDDGKVLLDILINVQLLKDLIGNALPCDPALPIIIDKALEEGTLSSNEVKAICQNPQQALKSHRRRDTPEVTFVPTEAPMNTVSEEYDEMNATSNEQYADSSDVDVMGDLKELTSSFFEVLNSVTRVQPKPPKMETKPSSSVESRMQPTPADTSSTLTTAAVSTTEVTPSAATSNMLTKKSTFMSKEAIFGDLYGDDDEDESEDESSHGADAQDETSENGTTLRDMIDKVTGMFVSSGIKEVAEEKLPETTTEPVTTAGNDTNVFEYEWLVEDPNADLKFTDKQLGNFTGPQKVKESDAKLTAGLAQNTTSISVVTPQPSILPKTSGSHSENDSFGMSTAPPLTTLATPLQPSTNSVIVGARIFPGGNKAGPPPTERPSSGDSVPLVFSNDSKNPWFVAESSEVDENKFHRHVVISIGLMALLGVVAIAVLATLRQTVVSRGSAQVDGDVEVPAAGNSNPSAAANHSVTVTISLDDDDLTPKKEAFQMVQKPTKVSSD